MPRCANGSPRAPSSARPNTIPQSRAIWKPVCSPRASRFARLTVPVAQPLRYGENPQDRAAFYLASRRDAPRTTARQGRSPTTTCSISTRACGSRRAHNRIRRPAIPRPQTLHRARSSNTRCRAGSSEQRRSPSGRAALEADPVSAYGGIIASDGTDRSAAAEALGEFFLEMVAAPEFDADALERLRRKTKPAHHALRSEHCPPADRRAAGALGPRRRAGARTAIRKPARGNGKS